MTRFALSPPNDERRRSSRGAGLADVRPRAGDRSRAPVRHSSLWPAPAAGMGPDHSGQARLGGDGKPGGPSVCCGVHAVEAAPLALLGLWKLHYFHRAFVYPLRMRGRGQKMPLTIAAMAFASNFLNAYNDKLSLSANFIAFQPS